LLLGAAPPAHAAATETPALGLADQRMLQTYLRLSRENQHVVQAVVAACDALDAAHDAAAARPAR
jgi:predicted lipoprotein